MRELRLVFEARKRGPELFEQGEPIASKGLAASPSAGEITQVDAELPEEAATSGGRRLGEESRKKHHRDRYAYKDCKRGVEKRRGIIGHDIADVRSGREIHYSQDTE